MAVVVARAIATPNLPDQERKPGFYISDELIQFSLMPMSLPAVSQALVLQNQSEPLRKPAHYDVRLVERPVPALRPGEVLVKINAAGFNHREVRAPRTSFPAGRIVGGRRINSCFLRSSQLWIRKGQYPGIVTGSTLGADGAGECFSDGITIPFMI